MSKKKATTVKPTAGRTPVYTLERIRSLLTLMATKDVSLPKAIQRTNTKNGTNFKRVPLYVRMATVGMKISQLTKDKTAHGKVVMKLVEKAFERAKKAGFR